MKKTLAVVFAVALALSACASVKVDPAAPPPTAEQMAAAKKAALQANFNAACKYGGGVWSVAKPVLSSPTVSAKIGSDLRLAFKALDVFVTTTCTGTLDVSNADAIIQRGYDIGGQVVALVLSAQSAP